MSILALWADLPWFEDLEDEDDAPAWPTEALTVTAGRVWWSASLDLDDDQ